MNMLYARIIDRGECESTNPLVVDGVPANVSEWKKYNFYPQNNMVGELMKVNIINVLHILPQIYVVMNKGIEIITEEEWREGQQYNTYTGMDERQWKIHNQWQWLLLKEEELISPKVFDSYIRNEAHTQFIYTLNQIGKGEERQQKKINEYAAKIKSSDIMFLTYNDFVKRVVSDIRKFLSNNGLGLGDKDILSGFLAVYVLAYNRALGPIAQKEDWEIFNDCYSAIYNG